MNILSIGGIVGINLLFLVLLIFGISKEYLYKILFKIHNSNWMCLKRLKIVNRFIQKTRKR